MANYKEVTLNGSEQEVKIGGHNCDIRNDGIETIYASAKSGVAAKNDGVVSIPSGQAVKLLDIKGAVYLLGTGSVQLCGSDCEEAVFKSAAAGGSGGGTVDAEARNAITALTATVGANTADITELKSVTSSIGNPNMLINSHFTVDQRGQTEYTLSHGEHCIDGWRAQSNVSVRAAQNGVEITSGGTEFSGICQATEPMYMSAGDKFTASAVFAEAPPAGWYYQLQIVTEDYSSIAAIVSSDLLTQGYNSLAAVECPADGVYRLLFFVVNQLAEATTIKVCSVKAEAGSAATAHTVPHPALALQECRRYCQIHSTSNISPLDLCPPMCYAPAVSQLADGSYLYSAEL